MYRFYTQELTVWRHAPGARSAASRSCNWAGKKGNCDQLLKIRRGGAYSESEIRLGHEKMIISAFYDHNLVIQTQKRLVCIKKMLSEGFCTISIDFPYILH